MFFGGKEVTQFINTSYTRANYDAAGRDSALKEAGEQFINATEFPTGGGLAYGGATAAGGAAAPLYSTANGIIKGVFYLQRNTSYNWSINISGTELMVKDTANIKKDNSLSLGTALFKGMGQYENYWQWTGQESYQEWVEPVRSIAVVSATNGSSSGNSNGDNNFKDAISISSEYKNGHWEYTYTNNMVGGTTVTQSVNSSSGDDGLNDTISQIGNARKVISTTETPAKASGYSSGGWSWPWN